MKRLNPYQVLLADIRKFCQYVKYPKRISMFYFPKEKLNIGWTLNDIYERTAAAEQLGYDVILISTDKGLEVKYQEKRPSIPFNWE